jgi:hypothetical protein
MSDEDDGLFGLHGSRKPVAGPPDDDVTEPDRGRGRWLSLGIAAGAAAVAIAAAIGAATIAPATPVAAGTTAPSTSKASTSSPPAPPTSAVPVTKTPAPETTPTVYADPAALADLDAVAATLTTPIALTSPTEWDQWLPEGKPYPGVDTADDLSTCPLLSDRLGAALGRKMSYWVGTLPGPGGCRWATVPLYVGPDAPNYPYLGDVDFAVDGPTTEEASGHQYHHEGRYCPSVAVPAAGEGTYLTRCEELDGITYTLFTRDTRTDGVWRLSGSARSDAAHPALDVFRTVVDGAVSAYG